MDTERRSDPPAHTDSYDRVERLLGLLDFEIGRLDLDASRTGWTPWAILAALAAVLWVLSSEVSHTAASGQAVCFCFLVLAVLLDFGKTLHQLLGRR